MPKAEKGSVKDIANRMKAKGLQKLKYYCQMCEKQCRDANGFKCHLTSESHLRQMKLFSDNAGGILDKFSKEFEQSYLTTLRMRHGTKKVNANNVYQELISDKQHIHVSTESE
jgi:DNA/RNA-binding protein KIN17